MAFGAEYTMTHGDDPAPLDPSSLDGAGGSRDEHPGRNSELPIGDQGERERLARAGGSYRILGEIARGGMGVVFRAQDDNLGREVAVKVLGENLVGDEGILQRFVEEAQVGGQLQHPGIVPVYDLGRMDDERPYFAMKLIQGSTLEELLAERTGLDDDRQRFLAIFEAVCQTVAYAHSKGVLHRDLKPANIMVGSFGEVQVVDWGLAKVLQREGATEGREPVAEAADAIETVRSSADSDGSRSIAGSSLGTPAFMPPEQARGDLAQVDERSDVFGLGGILCQILTGHPTYVRTEWEHAIVLAMHAQLGPARDRIDHCTSDVELKELALRCLEEIPDRRPADAGEVARCMQAYLSSLEEKAHLAELAATEARELRRRQRLTLALGTTVITALIAVGWVLRSMERQRTKTRLDQLAAARLDLDDVASEVVELQDASRHDEAIATARAAALEIESRELGEQALVARAGRLIVAAEKRADEARRAEELERSNTELLTACAELRGRLIDTLVLFGASDPAAALDEAYREAFRDYGVDPDGEDLTAALETLIANGIGVEIAHGLDDWASLRRGLHGFESFEAQAVAALAFDLDDDPLRTRMREALLGGDGDELLAFTRAEDMSALPTASLWVLSQGLTSAGHHETCFTIVRDGAQRHPDDFLLNVRAGQLYGERDARVAALGFLSSARGVRPESAAVHVLLAEHLRILGSLPQAAAVYEEALRLNPDYSEALNSLAWLRIVLGDYVGAAQAYGQLCERFPAETLYDYRRLLAYFLSGKATRDDVLARLESDESLAGRPESAAVWALCYHPDAKQRDPERVLAIQDSWGHEEPATEGTKAAALLQLGRPAEALAALEHGEELVGGGAVSVVISTSPKLRAEYAVHRARAYHDLGEIARAIRHLEAAEQIMRGFMYDGEEPWTGTPLVRAYRETAALLGR